MSALFRTLVNRLRLVLVRAQIILGIVPKTKPLPEGPPGFVGWVLYINKEDPTMGMLCWKMPTGDLIPVHGSQSWSPDQHWSLWKEVLAGV